ncbi:LacI family DNA-binding transcriptional regulator [Zhihengliuella flava]|uniref:DNA-binding LacI/PurR family transcriptional regulator n=1 Tax=Zhihengliuella flava TaxID=1285193 RepID=A0A931DDV7_9MICC|nr:LacI family DNA-binding transcriptional regulator [Zhihengliuella flava]MBG6084998.1 DNA-binding LacI/PurR family transcriptional regulator [Zhihengliuella flava]
MPQPNNGAGAKRATMKDVAALAGVSPKTVSNVLTGTVGVRESTRTVVEDAMATLGYVPNLGARGLRNGRTGIIGFALPDLATAFSASLTHAVVQLAHERGLAVLVEETAADPTREHLLVARAREHSIDGLILNPVRLQDSVVEHVDHLPPVVLIGEVEQYKTDRVFVDSRAAAREATEHLIAQGARRIAVVGGSRGARPGLATSGLRLRGYLDALDAAGIEPDAELQISVRQWTIEGGAGAVRALRATGRPFDAILCFTDSMALGAVHALHEAGLQVPRDVLVAGFDDVEHARFAVPALTTVGFDHVAYVTAALDLLQRRIDGRERAAEAVVVPHSLTLRESTAALPAGADPAAEA